MEMSNCSKSHHDLDGVEGDRPEVRELLVGAHGPRVGPELLSDDGLDLVQGVGARGQDPH